MFVDVPLHPFFFPFLIEKKKGNNVKENGNASYSPIFAEKIYFQADDLHF